jgi:hypothetical protein
VSTKRANLPFAVLVGLLLAMAVYGFVIDQETPSWRQADITHSLRSVGPGKYQLVFEHAPGYVHALPMSPPAREPELNRGTWLVLAYHPSSVPDANSVDQAVRLTVARRGTIKLGVRPCVTREDFTDWFPECRHRYETPVWLVLRDGRLCGWETGPLSDAKLRDFVSEALGGVVARGGPSP